MNPIIRKLEEKLDALTEEESQSSAKVDILNELVLEVGWDDPGRAAALSTEAFDLSKKLSYPKGIARGHLNEAIQAYYIGDFDNALRYHEKSLEIFHGLNDPLGIGRALTGIGTVYQSQGDNDRALETHSQALEIYRQTDSRLSESRALNDLGLTWANS